MPLPPIATIAACGSVITAVKSSWELSRMLKKKEEMKHVESRGRAVLKDLREVYLDGYMNRKSFDKWYDRYLGAMAEKDLLELRKIQEHVNLINRDNKSTLSRRSTYPPSSSVYVHEKSSHRGRARSADRRHSSRVPPPVYTVEEYEEEKRRPSHIDTRKAQSDHWHSHALPTSHRDQRQLEYTPETDSFDELPKERHSHHRRHYRREERDREGSHRGSSRSHSNSTVDRGRTRSRSVHTEKHVTETTDDADSAGEDYASSRRREEYQSCSRRDGERGRRDGRGR